MNELWNYFKKLPVSVKVKYVIALPFSIMLYGIYKVGELAEKLDGVMRNWVHSDIRR